MAGVIDNIEVDEDVTKRRGKWNLLRLQGGSEVRCQGASDRIGRRGAAVIDSKGFIELTRHEISHIYSDALVLRHYGFR